MALVNGNEEKRSRQGRRILTVGLVCLDLIHVVDRFPVEDTDTRVSKQTWCRGGNAGNSAVILSQLGVAPVECLATFAVDKPTTQIVVQDLDRYGVIRENCVYHGDSETPTSAVIVNKATGSRTILHGNRSLPELELKDFEKLDLPCYKWIHFEGRNIAEVLKMIERVRSHNKSVPAPGERIVVSVEVEKNREGYQKLFPVGDVVFVSRDYARHHGYNTAQESLVGFAPMISHGALLVCAWGDLGAWGRDRDGQIHSSTAYKPPEVVETLGAGDTFNAGVISSLSTGKPLAQSLEFGCRLAGYKCGIEGLDVSGFDPL